jgi:ComF family protein
MLKSTIIKIIDTIFPPRCLCCYDIINDIGTICSDCWNKIDFIGEISCIICSMPLDYEYPDNICNRCNITKPCFDNSACVFIYSDFSKDIIHRLKFQDNTQIAKYLSKWLARSGQDILMKTDILAPIPIHFFRLFTRKFNQSALIAKYLPLNHNLQYHHNLLIKHRYTKPQSDLNYNLRTKNICDSFKLNSKFLEIVKNKNITLIDDVMTTGATANECAKILKLAGASQVFILALARTCNDNS